MPATSRAEPNYHIAEGTEMTGTILANDSTDITSTITTKQKTSSSAVTIDGSGPKQLAKTVNGKHSIIGNFSSVQVDWQKLFRYFKQATT
jgi:hypothetical protein